VKLSPAKLKEVLVGPGFITEADFELVREEAKIQNKSIEELLVESDLIIDEHLGKLIAEELGYKFIDLKEKIISEEIIKLVPEVVAKTQRIIVFDRDKEGLKVAMADPSDYEFQKFLEKKTGEKINVYYATPQALKEALKFYRKEIEKEFAELIKTQIEKIKESGAEVETTPPIIKIVDTLIEYAYANRASDIHIEPFELETQVRYRIDGVLHDVLSLPKNLHNLLVARVKVLSRLRTDEHFAAQDGKFTIKFEEEKFDVRVSIVPVTEGENVVMRLHSEKARMFDLENLGLSEQNLKKIRVAIKKSYGMILATGPTGCGKTTTLYAILKLLNKPEVHIATIEDPVEYDMEGVSQIQVNPKTNLTFAKGLRAIVRQDPDIIMVGEIRDNETANIAVNSAMTGHLVLSSMHANTAATNLPRLMDMGAEPFLVASSVNIIVAQRLVRRICSKCRESYEIKTDELKNKVAKDKFPLLLKKIGNKEKIRVYKGRGCKDCVNTGYSGRTGIFEVLEIEDSTKELIMQRADADEIEARASRNGMTTMFEDGIEKVLVGITTVEELLRVINE